MKRRLLFVSPRFLFPVDSGGKIRTTQILRGMRGGAFDITLASPCEPGAETRYASELARVSDRFCGWPVPRRNGVFQITRLRWLFGATPISIASDRSRQGSALVDRLLREKPDVVVLDFLHSAIIAPPGIASPTVLFTHNVEAEIFERHAEVARRAVRRAVWRIEHAKMLRYEAAALKRFSEIVAVSARDAQIFERKYGTRPPRVISTGVDLDFFTYSAPAPSDQCVFIGSMDWLANIDAMEYFRDEIWPEILKRRPGARMAVVGRAPPAGLVEHCRNSGLDWSFSGFVDDVRPWIRRSAVSVVPLRIGGGTRLKVYEAMAMGCPVVSTSIGIEGLALEPGRDCLVADDPVSFAEAVESVMANHALARAVSKSARHHVETHASHVSVAREFERICLDACSSLMQ